MSKFYPLKVKEIIRETPEAVSISFEIPEDLRETFSYKAGQYITIQTQYKGNQIRRSYSLCSLPGSNEFKVTVKEVPNGGFSVYANNTLTAGEILEVHPPEGKFVFVPGTKPGNYAAFAAGSGITPILSIIKTVLTKERESTFVLVYGNRTVEGTIFYKELLELQLKYPERFFIEFIYSRSREENSQFGRIETSTVNFVLKNKHKDRDFNKYFLCGPEEMIFSVSDMLKARGVSEENIHFELFTTSDTGAVETEVEGDVELTITVDDEESVFTMDNEKTVLEVALENDIDVPYSCQGGICSSCIARITEGTAEMRKNMILTDSEIAEGLILTCQAQPTSSVLKVDYDDV